ncbi:hypothetical protein Bb109J_c1705 [Bdellovibrio bacteriovorus]|uniref:hypothetical protein n=1 Tax=Bdellovibrio bacteriovorus TaxID=959 RepID=UPI00045BF59A|nr:hypothetical protein [Bdellovibrio bacteriovorus]AHZ84396.1 hypothetical protein EP01_05535 [Bdellovibrio bacteriovorus]BEV68285.1 hypothetical protein Bb109J_c1705 [Bdellovibrio bacteriovorus]
MRVLVLPFIALFAFAAQAAQTMSLDAPEYAKHFCVKQGDAQNLVVPTVRAVIRKAYTTQVLLDVLDADCKGHKVMPKSSNRFSKPSLMDFSEVRAIAASPRIFRANEFSHQVVLEFYSDVLAMGERNFLLKLYAHDGSVYQITVTTRDGGTFLQAY